MTLCLSHLPAMRLKFRTSECPILINMHLKCTFRAVRSTPQKTQKFIGDDNNSLRNDGDSVRAIVAFYILYVRIDAYSSSSLSTRTDNSGTTSVLFS